MFSIGNFSFLSIKVTKLSLVTLMQMSHSNDINRQCMSLPAFTSAPELRLEYYQ